MPKPYSGPLRAEPLAIELHNTQYAAAGQTLDGLTDQACADAWLKGLGNRLPAGGERSPVRVEELVETRGLVREAIHAQLDGSGPSRAVLTALNARAARAPRSLAARWRRSEKPVLESVPAHATREDVVIAALATDAIELIAGPRQADVHACGAPGCVLLYLKDHPRRGWCSAACGNRARQARHYARTHATR
jgi:predicted RNA-binding Zn ribbon-like protein